jgi:hypothetical protein
MDEITKGILDQFGDSEIAQRIREMVNAPVTVTLSKVDWAAVLGLVLRGINDFPEHAMKEHCKALAHEISKQSGFEIPD